MTRMHAHAVAFFEDSRTTVGTSNDSLFFVDLNLKVNYVDVKRTRSDAGAEAPG